MGFRGPEVAANLSNSLPCIHSRLFVLIERVVTLRQNACRLRLDFL